jgi:O-succinylbenzoic acid--CoA ligase
MRQSKLDDAALLFSIGAASLLICSSGTEGQVKAVQLSVRSMIQHAISVVEHLHVTPKDTWLICLPFFHVGGSAIPFRCLVAGASFIISPDTDPKEINAIIDRGEATIVSVVPTMLSALLGARDRRPFPSSLRAMLVGGGPSTDDILDCCPQALPTYGATETGSMVTCARPGCNETERHSAGPCLPGAEIRIVNEQGEELSRNTEGYILARGPGLALGYWRDPVRTNRYFRDGWFHTGDIGRRDAHGNLHVLARRTDLILSGGENIYPSEIERALKRHPSVEAAVVLPLPDAKWGQVPIALVVMSAAHPVHESELLSFLEKQLARYKLPRRIVFANRLPLLANGKPDVNTVREMLKPEEN